MNELPGAFLSRMQNQLEKEYPDYLACMNETPDGGLRVNTLKLNPDAYLGISPWDLDGVPWSAAGFIYPDDARPGTHPHHAAGLYYLQEPAAMAVAELADPQPGERVLDLAAAPGGKSTHLASLMENTGLLVVSDTHSKRVQALSRNIERWGARNTVVLNEMPSRLANHFGGYFDRVLVDAPCSGEGMFRKEPSMRADWSPAFVEQCAMDQQHILQDAARLVRPGGHLVYSTCTFAPAENENTVARFLESHPEFGIATPAWKPGFTQGRTDWLADDLSDPGIQHSVHLWPYRSVGEGHYIAVLRKQGGTDSVSDTAPRDYPVKMPEAQQQEDIRSFWEHTLAMDDDLLLTVEGNQLYAVSAGMPDLHGLKVVHWGWWLGTMKKKRLDPSHAFAMGIRTADVQRTVPLTGDDPKAIAFLRGEVLRYPGEDGWLLVSVDGYPLGWGKRVNGRVKSHVPNWLRYL